MFENCISLLMYTSSYSSKSGSSGSSSSSSSLYSSIEAEQAAHTAAATSIAIGVIVFIIYLIVWGVAMSYISKAAKAKGWDDIVGGLWAVGFFLLPLTAAVIVIALPDKSKDSDNTKDKNDIAKINKPAPIESVTKDDEQRLEDEKVNIKNAKVGSLIDFGIYEQDSLDINAKNPIRWKVIAEENNKILLLSQSGIDAHVFNDKASDGNDWETSSLKSWLQKEFILAAFLEEERQLFDNNIFCLSVDDVKKYLPSYEDRICWPTEHAKLHNLITGKSGTSFWWLATPAHYSYRAISVDYEGELRTIGTNVDEKAAVRPAIWVRR